MNRSSAELTMFKSARKAKSGRPLQCENRLLNISGSQLEHLFCRGCHFQNAACRCHLTKTPEKEKQSKCFEKCSFFYTYSTGQLAVLYRCADNQMSYYIQKNHIVEKTPFLVRQLYSMPNVVRLFAQIHRWHSGETTFLRTKVLVKAVDLPSCDDGGGQKGSAWHSQSETR